LEMLVGACELRVVEPGLECPLEHFERGPAIALARKRAGRVVKRDSRRVSQARRKAEGPLGQVVPADPEHLLAARIELFPVLGRRPRQLVEPLDRGLALRRLARRLDLELAEPRDELRQPRLRAQRGAIVVIGDVRRGAVSFGARLLQPAESFLAVARARPSARRVVRGDRPAVALLVRPAERRSSLEVLALFVKVGRITVLAPARTGLLLRS